MSKPPQIDLSPYFVTLDELPDPFSWEDYFGNSNPVDMDIGCGRGLFVFNASKRNPDTNYIGLEIDYTKGRRGALRIKKVERENARFWGGDVNKAFDNIIPPQSVDTIRVYFPDPWWKRRHHKRRLFTNAFLDRVVKILKPNGQLHLWTDVEEYWDTSDELMQNDSRFNVLPPPEEHTPEHDMDYQTSFERKKRKLGRPIYRGLWQLG